MKKLIKKILGLGIIGTKNGPDNDTWVIEQLSSLSTGKRILDAGAGERFFQKYCSHLDYISQDFGKYDGKGNGVGIQMGKWNNDNLNIISDIISIPEPNDSFDAILCTSVFEHIPDPISAVKEFSRLLKKDGVLLITAPFASMTHFAPYHFATGFNRYFYEEILPRYDFAIMDIQMNGSFFDTTAERLYMMPEVVNKYTKTKYNIADKIMSTLMLLWLNRFAKKDIGSSELSCFRVYVKAIKK